MQLKEFFEGIRMTPEAAARAARLSISEEEYQKMRALFYNDKPRFYGEILCKEDFRIRFLYYYSRLACETYERYRALNISDRIFWDTFYDLTLWCENCRKEYGEYGINQYDWFFRHIECTIFRLGRLEFEKMDSQWELKGAEGAGYGEAIINVHIPQGKSWIFRRYRILLDRRSLFGEAVSLCLPFLAAVSGAERNPASTKQYYPFPGVISGVWH